MSSSIHRRAVLERHSPRYDRVQAQWPLQVGNGEFAFAVDATGLQTYPEAHPHHYLDIATGTLLGTMTQWAWHSLPPARPYELSESFQTYPTPRGPRTYVDLHKQSKPGEQVRGTEAEEWLRNNPHRLHLGRIGFVTDTPVDQLSDLDQHLDLWSGTITSRFTAPGAQPATVLTTAHPGRDAVAVTSDADWPIAVSFPYGSESWALADDWTRPEAHRTTVVDLGDGSWRIDRVLDQTRFTVLVTTNGILTQADEHTVTITGSPGPLDLTIEYLPGADHSTREALAPQSVREETAAHWADFWNSGAWVDFGDTADPRATELERRIVLSQYLTAINCAGTLPPSETGLLTNSWRGKFHLEMHWWHVAHFALWGRPELLERSMGWYVDTLDVARGIAERQESRGARWPKQVDPSGRESPSDIGTFLLWQQPHPIHLAELVVRAHRHRGDHDRADELQRQWAEVVFASADFMADIAEPNDDGSFSLGPPLVPAQESYGGIRDRLTNPAFELTYWRWALQISLRWQEDLDLPRSEQWRRVAEGIRPPHVVDGVLTAIDCEPYTIRNDHPSMLAAYGFVPPVGLVDPAVVKATLADVTDHWDWESTWGWDYPVFAMTASRLVDPEAAVNGLLMPVQKNTYGPNGHNRQNDRLPAYLPGNGGLLAAVALMVAGWSDGPERPGIPDGWTVNHEGLVPAPQ